MPVQETKLRGVPWLSGEGSGSSPWDTNIDVVMGPQGWYPRVDTDPGSLPLPLSQCLGVW